MRGIFRRQEQRHIFIHNDLDNAAHYFANTIRAKFEAGTGAGIALDCIACATMIAFSFEAYLNFFGEKKVQNWDERQGYGDKVKQVFGELNLNPDWTIRPYASMKAMKDLRNIFAHGKPVQFELDVEQEALVGELDGMQSDLSATWEKLAQPEPVLQAYDDLNAVWKEMLLASGIEYYDTITHGFHNLSLVRMIDPPPAE